MRRFKTFRLFAGLVLAAAGGCEGANRNPDGGPLGGRGSDGAIGLEASASGLAVDFIVGNCPTAGDPDAGHSPGCCRGPAPLTLTLVPLTAGAVDRYLWQFGDGTESYLPTPSHVYASPGPYEVTLVAGGPAGDLARSKPACVEATRNPIGVGCDEDLQCVAGAACLCAAGRCAAPFVRGICSMDCSETSCPGSSVCADLPVRDAGAMEADPGLRDGGAGISDGDAGVADGDGGILSGDAGPPPLSWRGARCLAPCDVDGDCDKGLRCRWLPSRTPAGQWVRACFASLPLDVGSSCRTASGKWDPTTCVGGLCANRGARGQCSLDCTARACPQNTACASFANGEKLCTPLCGAGCGDDPLLSCQPAGGKGPLAFTVDGATVSTGYCVPKECGDDKDCLGAKCVRGSDSLGRCQVMPR